MTAMHQRNMRRGRTTSPMFDRLPFCFFTPSPIAATPVEAGSGISRSWGTRRNELFMLNSPEWSLGAAAGRLNGVVR